MLEDGKGALPIERNAQLEHGEPNANGSADRLCAGYALSIRVSVEGFESIGGKPTPMPL